MSIRYGFFNSINGDRTYNAEDFTDIFEGILTNGVFYTIGNKFETLVNSSDMTATVRSGKAWFKGKYFEVEGTEQLVIPSLIGSNRSRLDYVCIKMNVNHSVRAGSLEILNGEETSGTPLPPAIPSEEGVYYYPIAQITVEPEQLTAESLVGSQLCPWSQVAFSPQRAIMAYETSVEEVEPDVSNLYSKFIRKSVSDEDVNVSSDSNNHAVVSFTVGISTGKTFHPVIIANLGTEGSLQSWSNNAELRTTVDQSGRNITFTIYTHRAYASSLMAMGFGIHFLNIPQYNGGAING